MSEVTINSDLDVMKLIDNEESAELSYIYTALFMVGKGLDFDVDEDFKTLVKKAVEGCSTAFALSGGKNEN
jgi:hypothetical protein